MHKVHYEDFRFDFILFLSIATWRDVIVYVSSAQTVSAALLFRTALCNTDFYRIARLVSDKTTPSP
jgi:hypothetical protein